MIMENLDERSTDRFVRYPTILLWQKDIQLAIIVEDQERKKKPFKLTLRVSTLQRPIGPILHDSSMIANSIHTAFRQTAFSFFLAFLHTPYKSHVLSRLTGFISIISLTPHAKLLTGAPEGVDIQSK